MILLNPGPVTLSPGVRAALAGADLCHREPEFADLQDHLRRGLLGVYDLSEVTWAAVLVAGSGTAAVEAMIASLVPPEGRLLVLENGVYGERMTDIAAVHGIGRAALSVPWGRRLSPRAVRSRLEADEAISHVAVVHHETTTGRLNDLEAIAAVCRDHGAALLVDAVSSFGAEALDPDALGAAACAATASKCLHGAPGVSFVVVRRAALPPAGATRRSLYLDLAAACRKQDARGTPVTQPVHVLRALDRAVTELAGQGGWRRRRERYAALSRRVRTGLERLGLEPRLPERETSVVLGAFTLPPGVEYGPLHDGLKERGFVIYAGQGRLADEMFRVSIMGAITGADIERFLIAVEEVLSAGPVR